MPWHQYCPTRQVSDSNNPRLEGDNTTASSRTCCPVAHTLPKTPQHPHSSGPLSQAYIARNNTARHQRSVINASPPSSRPSTTLHRPPGIHPPPPSESKNSSHHHRRKINIPRRILQAKPPPREWYNPHPVHIASHHRTPENSPRLPALDAGTDPGSILSPRASTPARIDELRTLQVRTSVSHQGNNELNECRNRNHPRVYFTLSPLLRATPLSSPNTSGSLPRVARA
jgi:hypothetical protein